ncbi:MAG: hydroxymethylglutaryl-CoA reductase, degradative, partial [Candidatus Aenigmarchaeota archaeon]|nr:hydroxymethylglutaryl-CoA reductase, degradative [Candidatus Aenigmarchaeota archaeon]
MSFRGVLVKSEIPGFYKLGLAERLAVVKKMADLNPQEVRELMNSGALDLDIADIMIENVVGVTHIPLGIAVNFKVNGKDYLVPMATEEPSVIAAASHAAKLALPGGFKAESDEPIMIGQVQLVGVKDFDKLKDAVLSKKDEIIKACNGKDSVIVGLGGGVKNIEVRRLDTQRGTMAIVHLLVDVRDAMGANSVNTMCETISPFLEEITGAKARLHIISNLAMHRKSRATAVWRKEDLGEDAIEGILDAYHFALNDPYRCATNNKGIMNGIDAVFLATGNDFRAAEAGAHAYAALDGYKPLARYERDARGNLVGTIEMPLPAGIIGGSIRTNPIARIALKILGVKSARELSEVAACAGLANNFAALRAMVREGIQRGHMKLHAKNIAIMAGAKGSDIYEVTDRMIQESNISVSRAMELLKL